MKIAHVHKYYYPRAGAERYMFDVMALQEAHGHVVAPFAMQYDKNLSTPWSKYFVSELDTSAKGRGVSALMQFGRALWSREAAVKFADFLDDFRPDVVHVHNIYTHISPSILREAKKRKIPVVLTVHDYALVSANYSLWDRDRVLPPASGLLRTARSRFIKDSIIATFALSVVQKLHRTFRVYERLVDVFLFSTEFVRSVFLSSRFPSEKLVVSGLTMETLPAASKAVGEGVLYLGRLESYKGIDIVLACARLHPEIPFKIIGGGSMDQRVREAVAQLPNLEYLGVLAREEVLQEVRKARLCIVPSVWHEPYGLVVVEAMAAGRVVIVSRRGGLPELVEDGVSGFVVDDVSVDGFSERIRDLYSDPGLLRLVGARAAKRARALIDPELHLAFLYGVYQGAVDKYGK